MSCREWVITVIRFTIYFFAVLFFILIAVLSVNAAQQEWGDAKEMSKMLFGMIGLAMIVVLYEYVREHTKKWR